MLLTFVDEKRREHNLTLRFVIHLSAHVANFVEDHGLEYVGQPLPAAVQCVLFKPLKPKREHLSMKEREEHYEAQGGKM